MIPFTCPIMAIWVHNEETRSKAFFLSWVLKHVTTDRPLQPQLNCMYSFGQRKLCLFMWKATATVSNSSSQRRSPVETELTANMQPPDLTLKRFVPNNKNMHQQHPFKSPLFYAHTSSKRKKKNSRILANERIFCSFTILQLQLQFLQLNQNIEK